MSWSRKFAKPIILKDGRTIATLREARELILALPERTNSGRSGNMRASCSLTRPTRESI
jgi:hypothetical protein